MKVEIYSREAIKELMQGEFPNNTAVISFCSPRKTRRAEEVRVYFAAYFLLEVSHRIPFSIPKNRAATRAKPAR